MRIAWFTPFSRKSAIGKYSRNATECLKNDCHIDLFLFEKKDLLNTTLNIVHYTKDDNLTDTLSKYDLVIYNLGDYLWFHLDIYEISRKVKGIIILHDYVMHNFFRGYYWIYKKNQEEYKKELASLYGTDILDPVSGNIKPVIRSAAEDIKYPFFERAIEGAKAVITHSKFLKEKVIEKFDGPVETIYFPFERSYVPSGQIQISIEKDKILLLTFGNINPNKRIDKVIQVIGESVEIRGKVRYVIIGSLINEAYSEKLKLLIKHYKLEGTVSLLGYQENNVLYSYMEKTDIFINLRLPAMEGASDSLLEQLFAGKPSLVTDNGFYSELPNTVVVKVKPEKEIVDIYESLKKLIYDSDLRRKIGLNAKKFAEERFNSSEYRKRFLEFANNFCKKDT
ncbi:glycosyltransferase family 4 protein [Ectobacillus funiculus]|uniref:Glycosyltransferase family 4 protein n=1 Tax=Ectobacillus funiculus TaxID=137993 RepID=A0ABV5WCE9_9BACI